jgi:hypothetical protein
MGNSWWTTSWPSYFPYSHNPCDGYNLPQWVILYHSVFHLKNYLLLVHCEHSSTHECLSCPFTVLPSKHPVTLVIIWMSPCFSFSFLSPRSCGMLLLFSPTVPQQLIFHYSITAYVWGGYETDHEQSMTMFFYFLVSSVTVVVYCQKKTMTSSIARHLEAL